MARMELLDEVSVQACNSYSNLTLEERPTLFLEFHSTESGKKLSKHCKIKRNQTSDIIFCQKYRIRLPDLNRQ